VSEIVEIVDSLEFKLKRLLKKIEVLEQNNKELSQELEKSTIIIQKQSDDMVQFKKQYDTLKIANSLLGSNENTRDTKLKINSLIREIDYCIAQLSD
jgi:cell division septum initiation protein DivIVA